MAPWAGWLKSRVADMVRGPRAPSGAPFGPPFDGGPATWWRSEPGPEPDRLAGAIDRVRSVPLLSPQTVVHRVFR